MLKINHIGYAVRRLDRAISQMEEIGYEFENVTEDPDRKIRIAFGNKDGYQIELIAPALKGSPVDQILRDSGPTPYHICYESNCFDADIEHLVCGGGYKILIPPAPATAMGGRKVVFLYSLVLGLLEIVQDADSTKAQR